MISDCLMMAKEQFCLRWNDFESSISNSFRELKEAGDFFDVTLVCQDQQVEAHKVILAACSPFFSSILKKNPHPHPLLYLHFNLNSNSIQIHCVNLFCPLTTICLVNLCRVFKLSIS